MHGMSMSMIKLRCRVGMDERQSSRAEHNKAENMTLTEY